MSSERFAISRAEWRFVWLVTGIVCAFILGTVIFGYVVAPSATNFLSVSASSPADSLIYFSYIEQARQTGHAFFWNVFTQELSAPSFFSPLWALLGYTAGLFRLSTPAIFSISLLSACIAYCVGLYWALANFLGKPFERKVAFVAAFLASGTGFIVALLPLAIEYGADFTFNPGYVLPTLLHSPLQILSQVLLIVTFALFVQTERQQAPRLVLFGAVVLLALIHPYDLVPLVVASVGYATLGMFRRTSAMAEALRTGRTILGVLMVCAPIGLYFLLLGRLDEGVGGWLRQNVTLSPSPTQMIIGFGPLIIAALIGTLRRRSRLGRAQPLLIMWAVVVPLLTYLPLPFQSRFANGYSVVLVVLATPVFVWVVQQYRRPTFLLWLGLLIIVFIPTSAYNYVSTYRRYSQSAAAEHSWVYLSADMLAAAVWLREQPRSVLLSQYATSRVLSSFSLQPAYQADSHQTLQYSEKAAAWKRLLDEPENLKSFMGQNDIRFYVETSFERTAYPELHESAIRSLHSTFSLPGITLYQVVDEHVVGE